MLWNEKPFRHTKGLFPVVYKTTSTTLCLPPFYRILYDWNHVTGAVWWSGGTLVHNTKKITFAKLVCIQLIKRVSSMNFYSESAWRQIENSNEVSSLDKCKCCGHNSNYIYTLKYVHPYFSIVHIHSVRKVCFIKAKGRVIRQKGGKECARKCGFDALM